MTSKRHIARSLLAVAGCAKSPGAMRMGAFVGCQNIAIAVALCERLSREGMRGETIDLPLPTLDSFKDERERFRTPPKIPKVDEIAHATGRPLSRDDEALFAAEYLKLRLLNDYRNDPRRSWCQLPGNETGYLQACCQLSSNLSEVLQTPLSYWVSRSSLEIHQLVLGGSGSGKSEAMLHQVREVVASGSAAVVVIDPHADFANAAARLRVHGSEDRLVYLCPSIEGLYPALNPFDIEDRSPPTVHRHTEFLLDAFGQVLGTDFTHQMQSVLSACISTLLLRKGSRISCLLRFLDRSNNQDLLEFARERHYSPSDVDFLINDFQKRGSFTTTATGLRARLLHIMGSHALGNILDTEKSSINIEETLRSGKSLIVSIPQGEMGNKASQILGCFIIAMLQYFGLKQHEKRQEERQRVFLYLDEAQLFISPSLAQILATSRKYGLHLCGATQHLSHGTMDSQTTHAFRENTAVRIVGDGSIETRAGKAKMLGVNEGALSSLKNGAFIIKTRDAPYAAKIQIESRLVERRDDDFLSEEEWTARKRAQKARYYREPSDIRTPEASRGAQRPSEARESLEKGSDTLEGVEAIREPMRGNGSTRQPPRKARATNAPPSPSPRAPLTPWKPPPTSETTDDEVRKG